MLDFGWSEFLLIFVLAIFLLGPRDIPNVVYQAGRFVRRLQYMKYGLTKQFDAFMEQNDLNELRRGGSLGDFKGDLRSALQIPKIEDTEKKIDAKEITAPPALGMIENEDDEIAFHDVDHKKNDSGHPPLPLWERVASVGEPGEGDKI